MQRLLGHALDLALSLAQAQALAWAWATQNGPSPSRRPGAGPGPQNLMLPIMPAMFVVSSLIVGATVEDAR